MENQLNPAEDLRMENQPTDELSEEQDPNEEKKKKSDKATLILRIVIAIVIIVVGILLILFFVAKAAKYDTIAAMLEHMGGELALMWKRITA